MAKITFIDHSGESRVIEVENGAIILRPIQDFEAAVDQVFKDHREVLQRLAD